MSDDSVAPKFFAAYEGAVGPDAFATEAFPCAGATGIVEAMVAQLAEWGDYDNTDEIEGDILHHWRREIAGAQHLLLLLEADARDARGAGKRLDARQLMAELERRREANTKRLLRGTPGNESDAPVATVHRLRPPPIPR